MRMLCANQQALAQVWPFLDARPPVLVDWLPWSHTFGGNHNFNLVLRNAGTLYVDEGKPAPGLFERTVRNLTRRLADALFQRAARVRPLLPCLETRRRRWRAFFRELDLALLRGRRAPAEPLGAAREAGERSARPPATCS